MFGSVYKHLNEITNLTQVAYETCQEIITLMNVCWKRVLTIVQKLTNKICSTQLSSCTCTPSMISVYSMRLQGISASGVNFFVLKNH